MNQDEFNLLSFLMRFYDRYQSAQYFAEPGELSLCESCAQKGYVKLDRPYLYDREKVSVYPTLHGTMEMNRYKQTHTAREVAENGAN